MGRNTYTSPPNKTPSIIITNDTCIIITNDT